MPGRRYSSWKGPELFCAGFAVSGVARWPHVPGHTPPGSCIEHGTWWGWSKDGEVLALEHRWVVGHRDRGGDVQGPGGPSLAF